MKITVFLVVVYLTAACLYGTMFAITNLAVPYYAAAVIQFLRMISGSITNGLVIIGRSIFQKGYWQIAKAHFTNGIVPILWISLAGILNLGLPNSLVTMAQKELPSSTVNLAMPLTNVYGALFARCVFGESSKISRWRTISMIINITGCAVSMIPLFNHPINNIGSLILNFCIMMVSIFSYSVCPVILKWKAPNTDITINCFIQHVASAILTFVWALITPGWSKIMADFKAAPKIIIIYPILIGVLVSGLAYHAYIYLCNVTGEQGANLVPIGQLVVGIIVGVFFFGEWDKYVTWEIIVNIIGALLLVVSMSLTVTDPGNKPKIEEEEEEEEMGEGSEGPAISKKDDEIDEL